MVARTLAAVLLSFCIPWAATAAPPMVAQAVPDHADVGIDPALKEIRLTFDQDMSTTGHSFCGGGPAFPRIGGEIAWVDSRTIVLPVALEPGRTYSFSVNCPSAKNFRSKAGEPAVNYPISFSTRAANEPAPALSPEQAKAAAAALRTAIDERYSYRDLRRVDWDAVFKESGPSLESAATPSQFARAAAKLLRAAADMHITVQIGEFTLPTHRTGVTPNGNIRALQTLVKDWKPAGPRAFTGAYADIPYLLISEWSGTPADFEPVFAFLADHKDAPALIIDARFNSGGDETLAQSIAGCFVSSPTVYSKNKNRDPSAPDGWTKVYDRIVSPTPDRPHLAPRVCVLTGKGCMSSNESFILMMREGANATLVGEPTYGSSGHPRAIDLGIGVSIRLPRWIDMEPSGRVIEGVGIQPDIQVSFAPSAVEDAVLRKAAELLKTR